MAAVSFRGRNLKGRRVKGMFRDRNTHTINDFIIMYCDDANHSCVLVGRHDASDEAVILDYNKGKPKAKRTSPSTRLLEIPPLLLLLLVLALCTSLGLALPNLLTYLAYPVRQGPGYAYATATGCTD